MPFTVSHIVAALPLNNSFGKRFSKYTALSPLVIGSMTPDIAYLTPFLVHQRVDSHSLLGIYLFCIPMGLTIYFLYHLLMAPVWLSLMPNNIQKRLNPDLSIGKLPNISAHVLLISLILGAITHVIWDFFTHQSGIPQYIAWMNSPLFAIDGYNIMPYRVLQHASSLIGLGILMFVIYRWYQRNQPNKQSVAHWQGPQWLKSLAVIILFGVSCLIAIIIAYINLPETDVLYGLYSAQVFLRHAIVIGSGLFLLGSLLIGILYQIIIRQS